MPPVTKSAGEEKNLGIVSVFLAVTVIVIEYEFIHLFTVKVVVPLFLDQFAQRGLACGNVAHHGDDFFHAQSITLLFNSA